MWSHFLSHSRRGHSVFTWVARYCRWISIPHSIGQVISSWGHIFLCSSSSSRDILLASHLLGQAMGNLRHCSLWSPSINWCSPVMWQYWQLTLRRTHSSSTWLVRHCRCKFFPQSLEHVTSSNWQSSKWLMMLFTSPCHSHPSSLLVQNTRRLLTVRSACLWGNVPNLSLRQMGQALVMVVALLAQSRQDLQNVLPQQSVRYGSLLGYWQILHINQSGGGATNWYSYPPPFAIPSRTSYFADEGNHENSMPDHSFSGK